jgi:hypothetical protein
MSTKTAEFPKPSTEPLSEIGKKALNSLRRYGGRPELLLKEHPYRKRRPRPDPGEKPENQPTLEEANLKPATTKP